jgi:hypothetical protein
LFKVQKGGESLSLCGLSLNDNQQCFQIAKSVNNGKKRELNSKKHAPIYALTQTIIKGMDITITLPLCSRIAIMVCNIHLLKFIYLFRICLEKHLPQISW